MGPRSEPPAAAGYSGTPLLKKLGIKPGFRLWLRGEPDDYLDLLGPLPAEARRANPGETDIEFAHVFAMTRADLETGVADAMDLISPGGMIWASWPKKASGVETELDGNVVRASGLERGLVDIKVCAVDGTWSGLKFVIPVADRPR